MITVWSALAVATVLPSGLNATESTAYVLLVRVIRTRGWAGFLAWGGRVAARTVSARGR